MKTYTFRDPFAGHISAEGETLSDAIEAAYQDVPLEERPAYVWVDGEQVSVPDGQCIPVA